MTTSSAETQQGKPARGHLVIKTYDPESGASHKYKTSKAAEVGRLVQMLGTLGRRMAAAPEPVRDEMAVDTAAEEAGAAAGGSGVQTPVPSAGPGASGAQAQLGQTQGGGAGGGGGGKGKKKKGKR
jgi:hypothetical protein